MLVFNLFFYSILFQQNGKAIRTIKFTNLINYKLPEYQKDFTGIYKSLI